MNGELAFQKALELVRHGRHSGLEMINELEDIGVSDAAHVLAEAQKYFAELKVEAKSAAVDAFRRGESRFEVEKKLRALGFHSWDAQCLAGVCEKEAGTEPTVTEVSEV